MTSRLNARTKDEFLTIINTFVTSHQGMSIRKLSSFALGSAETLPRYARDPHADIRFSAVNDVLAFIEAYEG